VISAQNDYASSDFDIRHSFSGALVYSLPAFGKDRFPSALTNGWSVSAVVVSRTGFPFNGQVLTAVEGAYPRPNFVQGMPLWVRTPGAPGGKVLNANAFAVPPIGTQGDEGRNGIAGFGLTEADLSLARTVAFTDRIKLEFRADAFNALNHPNFSNPLAYIGSSPSYLSSQSMLNQGLGGLNPLFQEGGPRSLQLSLRLSF
jgi:hypothetical protein